MVAYNIHFGSGITIGAGITAGASGGGSGFTIQTSDLAYATTTPPGSIASPSFSNSGWNYIVFNNSALYSAMYTLTGGSNGAFPVTWSAGSTQTSGYVYVEFTGNPNEFQFCPCDSGGVNSVPGSWNFPVTF
jgi:hypothetical protein